MKLEELTSAIQKKPKAKGLPVRFVAIDGHAGSGKSTLADKLAAKLRTEIIRTDDFSSWNNSFEWAQLIIERVFNPIINGEKLLNYPRSKWWETHHPEPVVNQPVKPLMIIEGVGALLPDLRPYITYGVWVDAPKGVCLRRGFERDNGQDGKSDDEIKKMWNEWYKKEDVYIKRDKPKEIADLIVDGTKPFD